MKERDLAPQELLADYLYDDPCTVERAGVKST
jgi:hypothetical protein